MNVLKYLGSLFIILFSSYTFALQQGLVLNVCGPIDPAVQDYIQQGLNQAVKDKDSLVILKLDATTGLEASMRGINAALVNSPIPVVTYIAPSGAEAANTSTFIVYASHLAAMAPGTNIGAASPIHAGGNYNTLSENSVSLKKASLDAAAYIKSLAAVNGRDGSFGEQTIQPSGKLSADQALKQHVVNVVANNFPDLLQKINGMTVSVQGKNVTIDSKDLKLKPYEKNWRFDLITILSDPNIVYLLLFIAIYGIFFELSNPGMILPGVLGVVALVFTLYAFQLMPINYIGLTLLLIGIAFILLEVFLTSYGILGVCGVVAFIFGSIMLFDAHDPNYRLTPALIFSMSILTLAFFFMVLTLAFRSHKKAIVTGAEGLVGSEGVVISIMNEQIVVRVFGEIWDAKSHQALKTGDKVKVTAVHGLQLTVEKQS